MARLLAVVALLSFLQAAVGARHKHSAGAPLTPRTALKGYSFEKFVRDFGRTYEPNSPEFRHRQRVFAASLLEVHETNVRNEKEGRGWIAGVNSFMDWTEAERRALHGYKPAGPRSSRHSLAFMSAGMRGRSSTAVNMSFGSIGGLDMDAGPTMRQQGNCGSCWAISAVEAVEAQLQRAGVVAPQLSAQALVDCVPNPQHCGGSGGCDGATGELAYTFMRDHGIPLESDLQYTARTAPCPQANLDGPWQGARRARVGGWNQLPSNQADPLRAALTSQGPVVVAVDGNNWFNYDSGVFDSCDKDAILGHAVLAKGYGEDAGKKYWLIQNSWGADWGEQGHIRLVMHDNEDQWCGTDRKPSEGVGCDGGPAQVTVCGTCGILYDPIVPTGVRLESGSENNDFGHNDFGLKADDTTQADVLEKV